MYFWSTSALADFESGESIKSDAIIRSFLRFLAAASTSQQPLSALQAHLSCIRQ
jgi:hypothetical protein